MKCIFVKTVWLSSKSNINEMANVSGQLLHLQCQQCHLNVIEQTAVGFCSIYGISIREKPPGCNYLGTQEQASYVRLQHLMPPAAKSANTASASAQSSGTSTHCYTHAHSACITSGLKYTKTQRKRLGLKNWFLLVRWRWDSSEDLKLWIERVGQDQDLSLCNLQLICIGRALIILWPVR